ncbi:MAG TPA: FtsK/SpoIIIE domain-containing protein [Streptosporangiaceae bacterium]|nr:FtsK/SpoIIIE domain-containing protein [Streptosporangiaceae bacterium]
MRISLTALTGQGRTDIVINGDSDMTVASVARSLNATLSADSALAEVVRHPRAHWIGGPPVQTEQPLWMDGRMLDPQARAARVLKDGALVTIDAGSAPATVTSEPTGPAEIRVAGGPASGTVHRLGLGTSTLGTSPEADVRLKDPGIPSRSLRVTVERGQVTLEVSNRTDATLDGAPVRERAVWPVGGMLKVGSSVLTLAPATAKDTHLEPLDAGGLAYNRPPRIAPLRPVRRLEVPQRPERNDKQRLRLFGALLFSVFGIVMAYALHQWWWALFALSWPIMQVGEWIGDRMHGRKSYKKALREYEQDVVAFEAEVERLRQRDERDRRALHPDPAEILLTATGPRKRLWERRPADSDTLQLRVGLADLPARIELSSGKPPLARTVPVALPLAELGVIGLTGSRTASRALARWLVAQAACLHSPRDLAIVVLSADPDGGEHWNWVRWLPHCAPREGEDCAVLVGTDPESVAHRVTELAIRISDRRRDSQASASFFGSAAHAPVPYNILVVLDGARTLRRVPGMPQVLSRGPEFGLYAICVDDDDRTLPEECTAVAAWSFDAPSSVLLKGHGLEAVGPVLADQVSVAWCDRVARALAPVRDVSREDAESGLPGTVRLLDLLDMPNPTPDHILASWTGGRTKVAVGVAGDGIFSIDLVKDGPHGLIAGTTGAGKSELLQTLIASLAVANRPDEMTFVLIDYKGGAAFKDCAALPHTVGMVTDLDGHLTERALASLAAELRRREELLLQAGAKDIEDYQALCAMSPGRDSAGMQALPRLVLVIDEFAAMVGELPDFVAGLVDIGRRGRSLGVHLILATQRPAGVVTADTRANTNLRIALRVTDTDESTDVLDSPDAVKISKNTPGRCYVKAGAASPQAMQSARIGGRRPGGLKGPAAVAVRTLEWGGLGRPQPTGEAVPDEEPVTDLAVLVQAIREAAARRHLPEQPSPWLEPLPGRLVLSLRIAAGGSVVEPPPVEFGVTDLPESQGRAPLALDLTTSGHIYVAGASRSGRSTVLRSLAGAVAASCSPYDVHLYGIDCGANALLPLVALPHTGAVVGRDQLERVERLLTALSAEVSRRQQLLAAAGFASLAEQRRSVPAAERLPWMVLLLDRWEGFVGAFEHYDYGRLVTAILQLLREGSAVGLRGVFAGDRSGLGGQVSTVFDRRLVMRMADPADYGYAGFSERSVPSDVPPGRVLEQVASGGPLRESQIGLLGADPSGTGQVAALQSVARSCVSRYGRLPRSQRPLHVDELPVRLTYRDALALDPDFLAPSPLWALVGAGGDDLLPLGVDLLEYGPGFVVAGPARSGRSTALRTLVQSLLDPAIAGGLVPVVLITPRRSPLRLLAGRPGVLGVLDSSASAADLEALLADEHRFAVVVDDAELVDETELDDALVSVLRTARDGEHAVIIGGTTQDLGRGYRGFISDTRRSRSGVLLGVESHEDGEIFGLRLPRNAPLGGPVGRGLLVTVGTSTQLQVSLPPQLSGDDPV